MGDSEVKFVDVELTPPGRAFLAIKHAIPEDWKQVPIPPEDADFNNPIFFLPLAVWMAPYGAIVFTVAARPAYEDGSMLQWVDYLCNAREMRHEFLRPHEINGMPCMTFESVQDSDAGKMRARLVMLEDGQRLFNLSVMAPEQIWKTLEPMLDRILSSFKLVETKGATAPLAPVAPQ